MINLVRYMVQLFLWVIKFQIFVSLFSQGKSDHWCSDLLKASEEFLSNVMLKQDSIDEELLTRHLFTVGEVAQVCQTFVDMLNN